MAGDPLKKVQSGDRLNIPAEAYNAFIDAARATRGQQVLGADAQEFTRQTTLAKVRNLTGANRDRFSVVGLNQPIVLPADNAAEFLRQTTFDGVTPASGYEDRFGVLLEPLATNKIGLAAVAGVVPMRVHFTATNHEYAAINSGDATKLKSAGSGWARILWHEDFPVGPDPPNVTLWALVLLGGERQPRMIWGTTTTAVLNTATNFQISSLSSIVGTAPTAPLTVKNTFGVGYAFGEPVVAIELANGDWINQPYYGRVYATAGDTFPETLFYKLWGHGTFNSEYHQPVYFEEMEADLTAHGPPVPRALVRAFTAKDGSGSEKFRLIRGEAYGSVTADQTSFYINNIVVLAGGLDPRTTPGDMSEPLEIINSQKESFYYGEIVTAIWFEGGPGWQTLPVERYRALRGDWYSGGGYYLQVKSIVPLDSGLDPRNDPTDPDETVDVVNIAGDDYESGDIVWADYNVSYQQWEARPKAKANAQAASGVFICSLSGSVIAGSTSAVTPATGATIYKINPDATLTTVQGTVYNPFTMSITPYSGELFTCNKFYEHNPDTETEAQDKFVIVGQEPRQRLASLDGFGEKMSLVVPEGGSGPAAIKWLGGEC